MKTAISLIRDSLLSVMFHLAPRFASALLFIIVGREAGPVDGGILALAVTYLTIFSTVMRGLDDLVVRQVSREPDLAATYLTNFLVLRMGLSLVSYGLLMFAVLIVFDYAANTATIILVLSLSLIPDSLAYVAQSILLAKNRFSAVAMVWMSSSALKLVGGWGVIYSDGSLRQLAWVWLIASMLGMVMMLYVAGLRFDGLKHLAWGNWGFLSQHRHAMFSFLSITSLITIETQADIIILSGFREEVDVGWYGAATTIVSSLIIFSQAYRFSVYPVMSRYAVNSPEKLNRLYNQSVRFLGMLVLPMVAGIAFLSPGIVLLVFGDQFQPTTSVLRILILTLIFLFLSEPNVRMMLAHERQGRILRFLLVSTTANILLNLAMVPHFGALGAAFARLGSSALFFAMNSSYVTRVFVRTSLFLLLRKIIFATSLMVLMLSSIQIASLPINILLGLFAYVFALLILGDITFREVRVVFSMIFNRSKQVDVN